ncbi:MAG: DUF1284 domain-containing protein [Archaeoglobaceae archaeon]
MVRLRGHHLICLQFFRGAGYDEVFVENLRKVVERAKKEKIDVVDGIDDVCIACPHNRGYCAYSPTSEKEVREMDEYAVKLLGVGRETSWEELAEKVPNVFDRWKVYCERCDWRDSCFGERDIH